MRLSTYIDLYALLKEKRQGQEENRAFGIAHPKEKYHPSAQLMAWTQQYAHTLPAPRLSEVFSSYLYGVTLVLGLLAFFLGVFSGIGLLAYSGKEPVNILYFIAMVVALPLLTMVLGILAMLRANDTQSVLVHISPAFWMEKILSLLPHKMHLENKTLKINPLLANWITIVRAQVLAWLFSFGLLLALLWMVLSKDIAFAWSTTLEISPETFHGFLYTLALPWRELIPSAVPSFALIEQSHYFRLGEKLSETMIHNASALGQWWPFLAYATVFYALFLRVWMVLFASVGLHFALKRSMLALEGAKKLLSQMNEPIITTHTYDEAGIASNEGRLYAQTISVLKPSYDAVQGWALSAQMLSVVSEEMKVAAMQYIEVGGARTIEEDSNIIANSQGEILVFVKSWEPPLKDFEEYVQALSLQVSHIVVVPVGLPEAQYRASQKDLDIWERKLTQMQNDKVWLKR